jgi:hypothetical protein
MTLEDDAGFTERVRGRRTFLEPLRFNEGFRHRTLSSPQCYGFGQIRSVAETHSL